MIISAVFTIATAVLPSCEQRLATFISSVINSLRTLCTLFAESVQPILFVFCGLRTLAQKHRGCTPLRASHPRSTVVFSWHLGHFAALDNFPGAARA